MNDSNQTTNESICEKLFREFRGILSWKWDDWSGTFLAEFSSNKKNDIRAILDNFFPLSWTSASINKAPQVVQDLDEHLGRLRPTQLLFSSNPADDVFVFCAWWPWASGLTISLRIAPFNQNLSDSEEEKLIDRLKEYAGI